MVVADASVVVAAMLGHTQARAVLADEEVHVPHHVDLEVMNALRRQVSRGDAPLSLAVAELQAWRRMGVRRHSMVGSMGRIWRLRENMSPYDAAYVALAELLGCALVTGDRGLVRAPGATCAVRLLPRLV